eukprot:scaffold27827_cov55-Cyclotella_meneghiniana.AAC.1
MKSSCYERQQCSELVCEQWDHYGQTTAAGSFQCLIMGMMNDYSLMRLESNNWKHLHQLTFEVLS